MSAEEKKQVQELIAKLGANEFDVREKATADLRKLGAAVASQLHDAALESKDVELRSRAELLAGELDSVLTGPSAVEALDAVHRFHTSQKQLWGKRYLIPVSPQDLAHYATHMTEMVAPAPRK